MVVTKYTDRWLRQQFYPEEERFTVETPPDPAHGDVTTEPDNAVVMQDATVAQGRGEIYSDVQWPERGTPSVRIDTTSIEGHGTGSERGRGTGGTTRPLSTDEGYGRGLLGSSRGIDQGAPKRQSSQFGRPYRFEDEKYYGVTTQGNEPPPITTTGSDPVLQRGLNAYPTNDGAGSRVRGDGTQSWRVNMPSWKRGTYYTSNVNRNFKPPNRTHTNVRMVRPDIVTIVGDVPPPEKSDKYATPWSSLTKFLPKRRRIRGLRHVPGEWDENIIATAQPSTQITPSAGMIVS